MRQQRWRRGGAVRSWRVRLFQGQDEQKLSIASCRCTVILSRAGAGRTGSAAVGATPATRKSQTGRCAQTGGQFSPSSVYRSLVLTCALLHAHAHAIRALLWDRKAPKIQKAHVAPDSLRSRSRTAIPSRFVTIRDGSHAESGAPSPTSTSHSLEVTPVLGPSSGAASSHPAARSPDREGGRDKCTCKYDALLVH